MAKPTDEPIYMPFTRAEWHALQIGLDVAIPVFRSTVIAAAVNGPESDYSMGATLDRVRDFISFRLRSQDSTNGTPRRAAAAALEVPITTTKRRRRRMTRAERKAVSLRMRKYWAGKRKKGGAK